MSRKKALPPARHPVEAMVRFDRLLRQMAPKAEAPPADLPKPPRRGKRRAKKASPRITVT